jgi:HTH-type transcriptional regulator / antitoxin HigA
MSNTQEFCPDWASAPGDTIADILRERALSEAEFAQQIGRSLEHVKNLLQGRATITIGMARQLERVLGGSVTFWMARDFQYRQDIARLHVGDEDWLAELPVGDMIKFGWLKPVPHPSEELVACLQFFDVSTVSAWHTNYAGLQQITAFRTSPSLDSRPAAVAAWLRQGEIEAEKIKCSPWNPKRFQEDLSYIRALTRKKEPKQFVPELQECCSESGIAIAIVRSPSGCRASGATRFLSPNKALLQLSFRYLTDDHFWFTFFHEAGHLLLHGERGFFLEGIATASAISEGEASEFAAQTLIPSEFQQAPLALPATEEEEANEFAARTLIPPNYQLALLNLPLDKREIIRFAMHIGVSPGIVVGQLQHLGRIRYNQLNSLKRRFVWDD